MICNGLSETFKYLQTLYLYIVSGVVIHMEEEQTHVRLMRLSKAAAMLDVSVRTIKRYVQKGMLHGVKLPGGDWRVYADEVYALIGEIPPEDIGEALGDEEDSPDKVKEVWE